MTLGAVWPRRFITPQVTHARVAGSWVVGIRDALLVLQLLLGQLFHLSLHIGSWLLPAFHTYPSPAMPQQPAVQIPCYNAFGVGHEAVSCVRPLPCVVRGSSCVCLHALIVFSEKLAQWLAACLVAVHECVHGMRYLLS